MTIKKTERETDIRLMEEALMQEQLMVMMDDPLMQEQLMVMRDDPDARIISVESSEDAGIESAMKGVVVTLEDGAKFFLGVHLISTPVK